MSSIILRLEKEFAQISTIQGMSSVFEAIASIRLVQIKDKVVSSTTFFNQLWQIYSQLRVDKKQAIGHHPKARPGSFALIAVTSDSGLIGDIDEKIIRTLLASEHYQSADIFVIGTHGGRLLSQVGATVKQVFELPQVEGKINVSHIAQVIDKYEKATLYYQQYISLSHQEVAQIDLFSAVADLASDQPEQTSELISSREYLFEPSLREIIAYMESVMLEIALAQVVLESKLAQYASRFNAMNAAKSKAKYMKNEVNMTLHRARRSVADDRTKAILSTMKVLRRGTT